MAFLELDGISKSFQTDRGTREVLQSVSLSVAEGEFVSIIGCTGSGKSTLLSIAAGLLAPDTGQVRIGGETQRGVPASSSFVFQNYSLLPWLSSLENVRLGIGAAFPAWTRQQQLSQAQRYLELVGLGNAVQKRPRQLSGGMRQRVAIARAFATEPAILFMDEPFGALDALTRETLQQELLKLSSMRERPVTTVMITNNVDEAVLLSERIVPMTRGPRATLGTAIHVDLPRARSAEMLARDPTALHVKAQIVEFLADFVHRAPRPVPKPGSALSKAATAKPVVVEGKI